MSDPAQSADAPKKKSKFWSVVRKLIFFGAIYAALSFLVLSPSGQWELISLLRQGYSMNSPEIAKVLDEIDAKLKAGEARVARFKDPAFAARVADIIKRQKQVVLDIEAIGKMTEPVVKGMDDLRSKLAALDQRVSTMEKDGNGAFDKQLQDATAKVASLKLRIDNVGSLGTKAAEQRKLLGDIEALLDPLKKKETGVVAMITELRGKLGELEADIAALEKGDANAPSSLRALDKQVDAAQDAIIADKKRVAKLLEMTDKIKSLGASVNLAPPTPMIPDKK